ncbi:MULTISPECIES: triose-phosphate isomerase [Bacillales]|nr:MULTISPECIES: triose-phosphate isomerase [Bacillales]MBR8661559.1 triose-phosphate isomerase [Brevibacillus sp. NL20B1]NNV03380.1 triose-phosphate isomerase [Brevibacillus sp. MCWH]REK64892.1 MAG: triose-phosphate isomerase [Brevibacillus sp.]UFJ62993.1 triose-phosphate isomerase [Anoxybacillus sediminis]
MRTPIIAGNWKMYKTIAEAVRFVQEAKAGSAPAGVEQVICAPFTALAALAEELKGTSIALGAQNVHFEEQGAFTGEVSPLMLKEIGVRYVIIGHSERRQYFNESDETVNKKVLAALKHGIKPIVCVGESLEQREAGETAAVVRSQTEAALAGVEANQLADVVIAYEPIWAIGTGKSSTAEDANETIAIIRGTIADRFGQAAAQTVRIQYGGSVKPENIDSFMAQPDIDGALVGGASLTADSYLQLVSKAAAQRQS